MKKSVTASMSWTDKYDDVIDTYMPDMGEGDTRASQTATAMNKLMYKWYNDGDVFDNHWKDGLFLGGFNDLSSYANWLYKYGPKRLRFMMQGVHSCESDSDYEELLEMMAAECLDESYLEYMSQEDRVGSIYNCNGPFEFEESYDDDEDDSWY